MKKQNDSEPKKHFILVPNKNMFQKFKIFKKWRITLILILKIKIKDYQTLF